MEGRASAVMAMSGDQDLDVLGAGDLGRLPSDPRERLLEVEAAHDDARRPEERGQLVRTSHGGLVRLGVPHRDGDLVREQLQDVEIVFSEWDVVGPADRERADQPLAVQDRLHGNPAHPRLLAHDLRHGRRAERVDDGAPAVTDGHARRADAGADPQLADVRREPAPGTRHEKLLIGPPEVEDAGGPVHQVGAAPDDQVGEAAQA